MGYVQRFFAWCASFILLIMIAGVAIWVLTHPETAAGYVTSFLGFLVKLGQGAADFVVFIFKWIGNLAS